MPLRHHESSQKISEILKQYSGAHIWKHYQDFGKLDKNLRKEMVHIIIRYFIDRNIWLSPEEFPKINELIKAEFPDEHIVSKFIYE